MSVTGKSPESLPASRCHCGALRGASRRVTQLYDQALAPVGLRITQYPVLAWLAGSGPMTMSVLAACMVMDRATLGHNLRPLEASGLVRIATGLDRRSRVVTLTDAGRERFTQARPHWRAAQRAFEAAFGEADSAALRTALTRLAGIDFCLPESAKPESAAE